MYTGKLIDELIFSVERVEKRVELAELELSKAIAHASGFSTYIYDAVMNGQVPAGR
jgi:hypothetical protein